VPGLELADHALDTLALFRRRAVIGLPLGAVDLQTLRRTIHYRAGAGCPRA
jgi:hypothetical protein